MEEAKEQSQPMTSEQAEFLQSISSTFKEAMRIVKIKNHDYAGEKDPWQNFKSASIIGLGVEQAILVRILDKISRVSNLLEAKAEVKEETIEDTIVDCINYLAILKSYREHVKKV